MGALENFGLKTTSPPCFPNRVDELQYLVTVCKFAPEIPMYRITLILRERFDRNFDPVRTRAFYERMERDGDPRYIEVVKQGPDGPYAQKVLVQAREIDKRIQKQELWTGQ